jgi:hypothetical protein
MSCSNNMDDLLYYQAIATTAGIKVHINYLYPNSLAPVYLGTQEDTQRVPSGFFWVAQATPRRKFTIGKQVCVSEFDAWKAACEDNNLL